MAANRVTTASTDETGFQVTKQIETLKERFVEGMGFVNRPGGKARPDAAAWAVLALQAVETDSELVEKGCTQLAVAQSDDGRVCIDAHQTDACWPTPLAILAWHGVQKYTRAQAKALEFLLGFDEILVGEHDPYVGHDPSIKGWPWVANTHSWVEPSALALIALRVTGHASHRRAQDAVDLLMDRQLPHGGWNYGNTLVFGAELSPMPETTGLALQALCGMVPRKGVEEAISYLRVQLHSLRTPLAIAWSILGLRAWGEPIGAQSDYLAEVMMGQQKYGVYDTVSLGTLLAAWYCAGGLVRYFNARKRSTGATEG